MTMRLTLRTLLAYLNQANLNLRATERIEAKVRESRAAQQLISDLQRMTSDPATAAYPPDMVDGPRDPNVIAEYLDNALEDDRVEDFEKRCFESSTLLAEIAACHQILSAICSGESAAASAAIRQRIYDLGRFNVDRARLPEQMEIRYLAGAAKPGAAAADASFGLPAQFAQPEAVFNLGPPPEERKPADDWIVTLSGEDLEELRARSRRNWRPWALFVAALVLIGVAIGMLLNQWLAPTGSEPNRPARGGAEVESARRSTSGDAEAVKVSLAARNTALDGIIGGAGHAVTPWPQPLWRVRKRG